jgi:hypothetical protein
MKKIILIIINVILISCTKNLVDKEIIENRQVIIKLIDPYYYNTYCYHIFFENIADYKKSFGINNLNKDNLLTVLIYPGIYNIYAYGLNVKSTVSKNVFSYSVKKAEELFDQINIIEMNMNILTPKIESVYDMQLNAYRLNVSMQDISEIFSLSSFSIKQGTEDYKKIYLDYNSSSCCYTANIEIIQNGSWFANISYYLKNKYDEKICEEDNIHISTSYFSDIYLGEY